MRSFNGTTEESHHGKSRKSHRIALGIAEKLGGRRAKRSQRSEQDPAHYSLALRQGDDRGSREWKDHELPAQFEIDSGIRKHAKRTKIIVTSVGTSLLRSKPDWHSAYGVGTTTHPNPTLLS